MILNGNLIVKYLAVSLKIRKKKKAMMSALKLEILAIEIKQGKEIKCIKFGREKIDFHL